MTTRHTEFANNHYFDKIRVGQTFKYLYATDIFVKTSETHGRIIKGRVDGKEHEFHSDDVCTVFPKLYVDDLRPCPEGWDLARSFHEAITMLEATEYDEVSLDHDIDSFYGMKELTGRDILNWLIARKVDGVYYTPPVVHVHSANPVGHATMQADINRYWGT